jgi:predicted metalloprotease with PDZ domain
VVKFKINNTGEYTGIGALITRRDDKIIIHEIYKDFPADKAGLKPGMKSSNRRCTFIRLQRRCIPTDERGKTRKLR